MFPYAEEGGPASPIFGTSIHAYYLIGTVTECCMMIVDERIIFTVLTIPASCPDLKFLWHETRYPVC